MREKIEKTLSLMKTSPASALSKVVRYVIRESLSSFLSAFSSVLSKSVAAVFGRMPLLAQTKLKAQLNPVVKLDYKGAEIWLHADSELCLYRATGCGKEPETVQWIEENLRDGDIFYDIGANVGAYSLLAASQHKKDVEIYAFEPSFSTYSLLCKNVLLNACDDRIYPFMIALGDKPGIFQFNYSSVEGGAARHSNSSLLGAEAKQEDIMAYKQKMVKVDLAHLIGSLDFPVPNMMKLDVDGPEAEVLLGAGDHLDDPRLRSLLVEANVGDGQDEKIDKILKQHGFELKSMHIRGGTVGNRIYQRPSR